MHVDMWKISDARGPIVSLHCERDETCESRYPNHGCKCVQFVCSCQGDPPKLTNTLLPPELTI